MAIDDNFLNGVKQKIEGFRDTYQANETAVRNQIVNPILRALSWDPEDPDQVSHEPHTGEGVPDYALIKDRCRILFIEAKKLSIDVATGDPIRQLAKYSFDAGCKFGVLTNGAVWVLFRSFQEGTSVQDRVIWKADLLHHRPAYVRQRLSTISRENIDDIEKVFKKWEVLARVWDTLLKEGVGELARSITPVVIRKASEEGTQYEFTEAETSDFVEEKLRDLLAEEPFENNDNTNSNPEDRGVFIGSTFLRAATSKELLVSVAEWLIKNGKLKVATPIAAGYKRYLINRVPKHKTGGDFAAPHKLSNGSYIETNYSAQGCFSQAKRLLELSGLRPDDLKAQGFDT